jgi:hypothetical protein
MSKKIGKIFIIEEEEKQQCDLCGKIAELRPYGPNGEAICFECGMKNIEVTQRKFAELTKDVTDIILL